MLNENTVAELSAHSPKDVHHTLTPSNAAKFIRKSKASLFISVYQEAPIADKPGRVFSIVGNVSVSKRLALKFIKNSYSDVLESRGAMINLHEYGGCLFIGGST